MTAVGVIPARWASTRFPGKPLVSVAGRPLIAHVMALASRARRLDRVLVATDDMRIADVAIGLGVEVVMTRADHPSGTDRVAEAVSGLDADVVVNIQGDEPCMDPALLDRLVEALEVGAAWDMVTAAAPVRDAGDLDNPNVVKVVWDAAHRALYFSRATLPFSRDTSPEQSGFVYHRHIGVYAYRRAFLDCLVAEPEAALERVERLEQLRALAMGARMLVLECAAAGPGIDVPDDVAEAERLLRQRVRGGEAARRVAQ